MIEKKNGWGEVIFFGVMFLSATIFCFVVNYHFKIVDAKSMFHGYMMGLVAGMMLALMMNCIKNKK